MPLTVTLVAGRGGNQINTNGVGNTFTYDAENRMNSANIANAAFQTTLSYDGMNRLTGKIYNDSGVTSPYVPTPWPSYTYDDTTNCPMSLGRLCLTQAGTAYYYRTYDALGRVVASKEAVGGNTWNMSYAYDFADELTSFTFPSGRVQKNSYDIAERISGVTQNVNPSVSGTNYESVASNYAYFPNGTMSDVYIGAGLYNGSQTGALHQNTTINSRLQVTGRTATSLVSGSTNILSLGFNYPSSPNNNGNLMSQSIATDGGFGASGLSATQYYGYDPFNRLTSMSESSTSGCPNGGVLCQAFQYDAYGNRAVTAGYTPFPTLTPTATSQFTGNRWLGSGSTTASYDAAGNQINTNGAGNAFTYDAENRMISANIANCPDGHILYTQSTHILYTFCPPVLKDRA